MLRVGDRVLRPDAAMVQRMVGVRRRLHRHPELSNQEHETTALLRRELADLGLDGIRELGETGLVVDVVGDPAGPLVVVRGDIDALPISERSEVTFRSEVPGVMHACGHDVHSAMTLGAAGTAAARRDELPGRLRFVFQPAEEAEPLGGRRVVAQGHLDGAVAAVALHVDPSLDVGTIGLHPGPSMASADEFTITVRGRGGHAGWPQDGIDAITAAAAVVGELQKIVTRRIDPRSPVALHIGRIAGGAASNVVADEVVMGGTLRTLDPAARATARRLLAEVSEHVARANGAQADVEIVDGEPVLDNHRAVIDALAAAAAPLGPDACRWLEQPTMSSEDFAFYTERLPAAMAWVGVRNEAAGIVAPLHHPGFAVDEAVIPIGTELLLGAAQALLASPPANGSRE